LSNTIACIVSAMIPDSRAFCDIDQQPR